MSVLALEWGVASRPLHGEAVSGDQHLVEFFPGGALIVVLDGLGHGPSAEAASRTAAAVLRLTPERPVDELTARCHRALRQLRGVVMSLASFDAAKSQMTWLGVGNVEGVLVRAASGLVPVRERLLVRGGIVGQSFGPLTPATVPMSPGDVVIFATDGIDPAFLDSQLLDDVRIGERSERIAERILERHAVERDDALVLVARYGGAPA